MTWGWCSPIDEADHARETIQAIRALSEETATIEGEIVDGFGPGAPPVARSKVAFVGTTRSYETTGDARGSFSLVVEPGHYQMESEHLRPTIPYSREDTGGFDLEPGQCAQFQLQKVGLP